MSPEESRKEKYAQLAIVVIFGAMAALAAGGIFRAVGREKSKKLSIEHTEVIKKEYKGTIFEEMFFDSRRSGR